MIAREFAHLHESDRTLRDDPLGLAAVPGTSCQATQAFDGDLGQIRHRISEWLHLDILSNERLSLGFFFLSQSKG
jgi:hypothetical protein